jgi:putative hydrolase of the HAD superfamily
MVAYWIPEDACGGGGTVHEDLSFKAILFDFYGTLINVKTDEHDIQPWYVLASFLHYQGAKVSEYELQTMYFNCVQENLDKSTEPHPDVNVIHIFRDILTRLAVKHPQRLELTMAQLLRSLTIKKFDLYPETFEVLTALAKKFRLGMVSDSQEAYIIPELHRVALDGFFETVAISSQYGYRKPDSRLFHHALKGMGLSTTDDVLYVGDDWERDIAGAFKAGIQSVWIQRGKSHKHITDDKMIHVCHDLRGLLRLIGSEDDR